jgi:hypothetical protein
MEEGRRAERIHHLTHETGLLSNISETGMGMRADAKLNSGALISIELTSREITIVVKARVVYCKPPAAGQTGFCTGLQFVDLTEKQKENIFDMVDSYAKGVPIHSKIVK